MTQHMATEHQLDASADNAMTNDLAAAELSYLQSAHHVDLLHKEEESRRLRARIVLSRGEIDDLSDKLWEEQERGEEAEVDAEEWQSRAEESHARLLRIETEFSTKTRELETAHIELASLSEISANSQQLLQEKLSLTRELEQIKPELEHLRSTTTSNKGLLTEKLTLERELNNIKAELESEREATRRLRDREVQSLADDGKRSSEIDAVKKELAKAQRDLARAEKKSGASESKRIQELEQELTKELRAREAAETSIEQLENETIANLEKQLEKEREKRQKLLESTKDRGVDDSEGIRGQLEEEQQQRQHIEKEYRKLQADYEADKAVLEDKLDQFRTKLRSTKEKLKESQTSLMKAQTASNARPAKAPASVQRKRSVQEADPDAAIGTPGDRPAAKRSKRASSLVGEKSTFSITPYLNKTTSVLDSPASHNPDEPIASIEDVDSPSVARSRPEPVVEQPVKPLGIASPGKSNLKVAKKGTELKRNKTARASSLEQVLEEEAEEENEAPAKNALAVRGAEKENRARAPSLKPQLKARKSLSTFASFREGSLPPQPIQQKKKRKLGGAGLKTIFDEDEEGDHTAAPIASRVLGAQRSLGAFGGFGGGLSRVGGLGQKKKGPLTTAEGGFQFSPLKRNRAGSVRPSG